MGQNFTELPSIEKKRLLVKRLGTKVDKLFPEEEEDEELVQNHYTIVNHAKQNRLSHVVRCLL